VEKKKLNENKVTEFLGSDCAGSPEVKHWPCVRAIALVALGRTSAQLHMMLVLPALVWGLVRVSLIGYACICAVCLLVLSACWTLSSGVQCLS